MAIQPIDSDDRDTTETTDTARQSPADTHPDLSQSRPSGAASLSSGQPSAQADEGKPHGLAREELERIVNMLGLPVVQEALAQIADLLGQPRTPGNQHRKGSITPLGLPALPPREAWNEPWTRDIQRALTPPPAPTPLRLMQPAVDRVQTTPQPRSHLLRTEHDRLHTLYEDMPFADESGVSAIFLSADAHLALSGSYHRLALWDVASGNLLRSLSGHDAHVNAVCLNADARFALSASRDMSLKFWEMATGLCLHTFTGHTDWVNDATLSADARFALSASDDGTLRLWDTATGACLRVFDGHASSVWSLALSSDARLMISGSRDRTLRLWDVVGRECLRAYEGHSGGIRSVSMSADARLVLSGSEDTTLRLWDVETGACLRVFEGHRSSVDVVCLSADGRRAISGSYDWTLRLWDVEQGVCIGSYDGYARSACFSADARVALLAGAGPIRLWLLDWVEKGTIENNP